MYLQDPNQMRIIQWKKEKINYLVGIYIIKLKCYFFIEKFSYILKPSKIYVKSKKTKYLGSK